MLTFNKVSMTVSGFSIFISTIGLFTSRKAFKEAVEIEKQIRELVNLTFDKKDFGRANGNLAKLTILIPARNEVKNIEKCLNSVLEQDYPDFEVIAIDDNSTDATPDLLAAIANRHPDKTRLLKTSTLEEGWLGKPNALWLGYNNSSSQSRWLLFLDADIELLPGTLRGAVTYAQNNKLGLLSLAPGLKIKEASFWYKTLVVELAKLYSISYINPFKPPKKGSVEEASAIGAFILVQRQAYEEVGGHAGVKNCIIEDIELARNFRKKGYSTLQIPAFNFIKTEGYGSASEIWEGVTKNFFLVAHRNWAIVAFTLGVEFIYSLLPLLMAAFSIISRKPSRESRFVFRLNLVAIAILLVVQNSLNKQLKISPFYSLLYPIASVFSSILMLGSGLRISLAKRVSWKNRNIEF